MPNWNERLNKMAGRLAMRDDEADLLAEYAAIPGDHVEIGTLWGGTALVAGLSKTSGHVWTIDPMTGGWWDDVDPMVKRKPTPALVDANLEEYEMTDMVTVVRKLSNPWPIPDVKPVTIFIDGDHRYEGVRADWLNASKVSTRFILMHDCNSPKHPGVERAFTEALHDPAWKHIKTVYSLAVFERVLKVAEKEVIVQKKAVKGKAKK